MDEPEEADFLPEEDIEEIFDLDNEAPSNDEENDTRDELKNGENEDEIVQDEVPDESIFTFQGHKEPVFCCDVSHDDKIAVTGGQDDRAIVWETQTGQKKFQTEGHKDSIVSVKFNKNSSMVATGDMSGLIFVWDLEGNRLYDFEVDDLNWLLWHTEIENVLFAGTQEAWMWRLSKANPQCKTFQSFGCANLTAKLFNDGKRIGMGYEDGSIRICDLKETKVITAITGFQAHKGSVTSLDVNSDDTLVATGSTDSSVKILNVTSKKILMTIALDTDSENDSVESIAFGALNTLVVGSLNGFIQVWHISTQTKRNELKLPMGISKLIVDRNDLNLIYTGGLDAVFRVIDLRTCQILTEKKGHRDQILDFSIASDSKYVLTCSDDSTCKIFKLE